MEESLPCGNSPPLGVILVVVRNHGRVLEGPNTLDIDLP